MTSGAAALLLDRTGLSACIVYPLTLSPLSDVCDPYGAACLRDGVETSLAASSSGVGLERDRLAVCRVNSQPLALTDLAAGSRHSADPDWLGYAGSAVDRVSYEVSDSILVVGRSQALGFSVLRDIERLCDHAVGLHRCEGIGFRLTVGLEPPAQCSVLISAVTETHTDRDECHLRVIFLEVVTHIADLVLEAVRLVAVWYAIFEDVSEQDSSVLRLRNCPVEGVEPLAGLRRNEGAVDVHQQHSEFNGDLLFDGWCR